MILKYDKPAPIYNEFAPNALGNNSWATHSLPIGNGYFGANIFGRTITERIQISEPTLVNPWLLIGDGVPDEVCSAYGVNNFAEVLIDLNHEKVTNYERSLSLEDACARVCYTHNGVNYTRTAFTSHPDKVLVIKLEADKNQLSFDMSVIAPFIEEVPTEQNYGFTKTGKVVVENDTFTISGTMDHYGIKYKGVFKVIYQDGELISSKDKISVQNASQAVIIFSCDTNYVLSEKVFCELNHKSKLLGCNIDEEKLNDTITNATKLGYDELLQRHLKDYQSLYSKVKLTLGNDKQDYTDKLLNDYKNGKPSSYLETLLFQYGRYLLISSSRTRLPAHLQGIWSCYNSSPWSCGYWHNINVQMNYWPCYSTGLTQLFIPYINYAKAFMKKTRDFADEYILNNYPENYGGKGNNGWIIGTGCSAYYIEGFDRVCHSGPGTGAFTALMFWDYYDYTRDIEFLKDFGYPALKEMSLFFSKVLTKIDGKYLIRDSASPENEHNGQYYKTVGCAFDQQMVYENFKRTIQSAEILGEVDHFILNLKRMLPHLDPVLIGDDGQIKEYREETHYSSIGDPLHRHVSHLLAVYPATIVNSSTPEWIKGAQISLDKRGKGTSGWSIILRLLCWARIQNATKCYEHIKHFITTRVNDNLWGTHPPVQLDGNFGFTASVSEMLLQSHADYIEIIPTIPTEWENGEFAGLVTRGNFVVDCKWKKGKITYLKITSNLGGELKVKLPAHLMPKGVSGEIYCKETFPNQEIIFTHI